MKRLVLFSTLFTCLFSVTVFAQSNTFPTTGNVGIGTILPSKKLEVNGTILSTANYGLLIKPPSGDAIIKRDNPGSLIISSNGSGSSVMFNYNYGGGNVGIGTDNPSEKLAVNGKIRSKEVIVEATGWPDYVFEADYDLPTLVEIEAYIKANKHLPDVPSAKQVEENGLILGEMNALLLKKIEELTLHTIAIKKEIDSLKKENEVLKEKMNRSQD